MHLLYPDEQIALELPLPPFPKPKTSYAYDLAVERRRLHDHRRKRGVPVRGGRSLLIGSWIIANLGLQERRRTDLQLIAKIGRWFDILAVQECRENIGDLYQVAYHMGSRYRVLMTEPGGSGERMVYLYDSQKVRLLDEVGEVGAEPKDVRHIKVRGVRKKFGGFDRQPYLASFQLIGSSLSVQLASVHLFFGSDAEPERQRRALECAAMGRWARLRAKSTYAGARALVVLGDFNLPKARRDGSNTVLDALISAGLVLPGHSTRIGSSISTDNRYDQVAMFPEPARRLLAGVGLFDFDQVVLKELWERGDVKVFNEYVRYYLSDHRAMWAHLRTGSSSRPI